jgi:hypothetical protein
MHNIKGVVIILTGIFVSIICHEAYALTPVLSTNDSGSENAFAFSQLQSESAKSALELKIAQSKLEQLQVNQKINQLTGNSDLPIKGLPKLKLLQVMSFNGNKSADISLYGQSKTYKEGERLVDDFVLKSIDSNSIVIVNDKTNTQTRYFVSSNSTDALA